MIPYRKLSRKKEEEEKKKLENIIAEQQDKLNALQKYNEEQRVLESNFLPSKLNGLCVNIWDDYSETEPDPTYAYLEVSDVPDFFTNQFLTWFLPYVKAALDNEKISDIDVWTVHAFFSKQRKCSRYLRSA